ncbi:MAG: multidrug transporter subunit MdtC [Thiomonas sp. 20-64-9]|uniref:efflux RND transporter permease subunit n=1 Tax=unclassified Thiomonas TaxID=2625466 RepID=UPI000BD3255D|nr:MULTISPECIES: efflux RND transporter permease subunit [unclassified Thiomonas]OYV31738.1 MAG: multidrug transporter subunit MdtC [Thiomonas sp. 20-64-9]OZB71454.1 MAG: multidrug transporter subunit MdtC [Thiomonas sp. 13-64-67]
MNPSALFIRRPIATSLLALAVLLAGLIAFRLLPVSPLPQVDFPTIVVNASMAGASPEVMAATVATPLERSLGTIAGISQMTSSSSLGSTRVILQFSLSKNINDAAREVQAAINAAIPLLPSGLTGRPTYKKMNPADAPIMILSLTSKSLSRGQMFDAGSTILAQKISQIAGIGSVTVGGAALPAVRVELDLPRVNGMGLGLEQVRQAIASANVDTPKGAIDSATHRWQVGANDQLSTPQQYQHIVVGYRNGAPIRLDQIAQVYEGLQNDRNMGLANGQPSVQLIIYRQPGANIIDAVEGVKAALPQLKASIPAAIDITLMSDRTTTIRASLDEVEKTLILAVLLVIAVVWLFLRDWRATLIPAIAVPLSLVGTFAAMWLLDYSLDNLSLMALIVATGFVVDDAIVVLENIMRHVEEGLSPLAAAFKGAREVGFTVLSMSISLVAVFIPVLFMGGIVGRLFHEFAVTLSVAIGISLLVSLTVTPMLASRWLRPQARTAHGAPKPSSWLERGWNHVHHGYARSLRRALLHPVLMLVLFFSTIGLTVYLFKIVPKGFFPTQDTGLLIGSVQADQSISFQDMSKKLQQIVAIVRKNPGMENVVAFTGGGTTNSAFMFMQLKPIDQRKGVQSIIVELRRALSRVPGTQTFMFPVQDIRAGGRPSAALYEYTLQASDLNTLREWEPKVLAAFKRIPGLNDVNSDQQANGLQLSLVIDRAAAARYGIAVSTIDQTLNDAFGQRLVSTIYKPLNQYRVVMEAAQQYQNNAQALNDVFLVGSSSQRVPLSALAHQELTNTPLAVNHQGLFVSSTISFNLDKGVSLGSIQTKIDDATAAIGLPSEIHGGFQGTAQLFSDTLKNEPLFIMAAIFAIYIVLGMLYESTLHPLTILSTLPPAGLGALLALQLTHTEFSIIALIGVFLLIGIVKKNAILMVDFALTAEREHGASPRDAIYQAATLRLRPILMTTLAALGTALPLAFITGNGAELRQPLGISIAGGLIVSQALTLYTTPVIYLELDRLRRWTLRKFGRSDRPAALDSTA